MQFDKLERKEQHVQYGSKVHRITPTNTGGCCFEVVVTPFGNCQMFSIAWMDYFLRGCENSKDFIANIRYAQRLADKKLLIVDVKEDFLKIMKDWFQEAGFKPEETIAFEQPYVSTNGSSLTLVQINLIKILAK